MLVVGGMIFLKDPVVCLRYSLAFIDAYESFPSCMQIILIYRKLYSSLGCAFPNVSRIF